MTHARHLAPEPDVDPARNRPAPRPDATPGRGSRPRAPRRTRAAAARPSSSRSTATPPPRTRHADAPISGSRYAAACRHVQRSSASHCPNHRHVTVDDRLRVFPLDRRPGRQIPRLQVLAHRRLADALATRYRRDRLAVHPATANRLDFGHAGHNLSGPP